MELATMVALAFQGEPKLFVGIKLSYKLLNTSFALAEYCN